VLFSAAIFSPDDTLTPSGRPRTAASLGGWDAATTFNATVLTAPRIMAGLVRVESPGSFHWREFLPGKDFWKQIERNER